jgi:hypothetical protein
VRYGIPIRAHKNRARRAGQIEEGKEKRTPRKEHQEKSTKKRAPRIDLK